MPQQQVNNKKKIMKDLKQFSEIELRTQDQININGGEDITAGDVAYAAGWVVGTTLTVLAVGFGWYKC